MISPSFFRKHWFLLSCSALLLLILPFFILSFFTWPSADDLSISFMAIKAGFWNYQALMYNDWTGRYTANFLEALNPLCWNQAWGYRLIPLLLLVALFFSVHAMLSAFARENYSRKEITIGSLILFALILNLFPGISEGIYWMTGAVEYLLASILSMFTIAILIKLQHAQLARSARILRFIMIAVFLIMIAGLNEISSLLMLGLLIIWLVWTYSVKRKWDFKLTGLILILTGAIIAEMSAPGNFARMSVMSEPMNAGIAAGIVVSSFAKIIGICLQSASFLLLSILFIPFAARKPKEGSIAEIIASLSLIKVLLLSALIILCMYVPQALAMGINPPLRVHGLTLIVIIWLWFLILYIAIQSIQRKLIHPISIPSFVNAILVVAIVILTLTDFSKEPSGPYHYRSNIIRAWSDLGFRATPYEQQMQERLIRLQQKPVIAEDTIVFEPLRKIPTTIHFVDLTDQPSYWINVSYSEYYHCGAVQLKSNSYCNQQCTKQ